MAELRIRVGAVVDSSVDAVFPAIGKAMARARQNTQRELDQLGTSIPRTIGKGVDKSEKEFAKLSKWAAKVTAQSEKEAAKAADAKAKWLAKVGAAEEKAAAKRIALEEKEAAKVAELAAKAGEAKSRAADKALAQLSRDLDRQMALQQKAAARAERLSASSRDKAVSSFALKAGNGAAGLLAGAGRGAMSFGARMVGDLARGAGVNMDPASMVQSYVERQSMAVTIAAEGHIEGGKGAAGQRQDPNAIMNEASAIAKDIGGDSKEMLAGLRTFVGFTGDLETGRAVMRDMAKISVGMGASMEDVQSAAGKISKQLGDTPNKAQKISDIMLKLSAMGKIGAAPIEAFAAELSKLAPMAAKVGGGEHGIENMAVMMQLAQAGGAKGASQASTAAVRFVDSLTKGPTAKAWAQQGLTPFTDATHQRVKEPLQIMMDVIQKTRGDQTQISKLFTSGPAKQVLAPLLEAYLGAGGGKANGQRVVNGKTVVSPEEAAAQKAAIAAYHEIADATQSSAALEKDLADAQSTAKVKAERFNAAMQDVADHVSADLLPALEKAGPTILQGAEIVGKSLTDLAPAISATVSMIGDLLGVKAPQKVYDTKGVIGDTLRMNDLTSGDVGPGGRRISKDELKHFQQERNDMAAQSDQDRDVLQKLLESKGSGLANMSEESRDYSKVSAQAAAGDKDAKEIMEAHNKYATDKANADAIEAAMGRVMKEVLSGVLRVEVTNQPGSAGAPVKADRSGTMPASRPKW